MTKRRMRAIGVAGVDRAGRRRLKKAELARRAGRPFGTNKGDGVRPPRYRRVPWA